MKKTTYNMKLAIIGASTGQLPLCLKAKERGIYTICFAWPEGAVCKEFVDKFYPVSIIEKDKILSICKSEKIDGVVSNGSDLTAEITSYIATCMNLHGINYDSFCQIKDKSKTRLLTKNINGLSTVKVFSPEDMDIPFPCIVKPKTGSAKKGVSLAYNKEELSAAINYSNKVTDCEIMIEEYVSGAEISVESISYEGMHYIIQITDKENSGAPHFVELSHHQPSKISDKLQKKIKLLIPSILNNVGIDNGATHIELKIENKEGTIHLIEINPRGGGDEISNQLVELSTGYDYLSAMIDVALGIFKAPDIKNIAYSGIYFLCAQSASRLSFFQKLDNQPWLIEKKFDPNTQLSESSGNYDRNGYFIYQSHCKIII